MSNGDAFVGDAAMNFLGFCGIRYRPRARESTRRIGVGSA
jgi:hypothetical protein